MVAIGLLLAFLLCWPTSGAPAAKTPVFVNASFLDKNRLFVENLNRNEIRVFEDGSPREIEYFAGSEVPLVYCLLFDRGILPQPFEDMGLIQNTVSSATAATNVAYQLVDLALGSQAGFVATYDREMRVVQDFTQDGGRIKEMIQQLRGQRSTESSSLYGPLFAAVSKLGERNEKRRVLVLFVNFLDTETGSKLRPLKNLLAGSNLEFFAACFGTKTGNGRDLPPPQSEASLRELASGTAGDVYYSQMEGIDSLGRRIANQIRTLYTIGFESEAPSDKPAKLTIECTRPGVKVKTHPVVPTLQ